MRIVGAILGLILCGNAFGGGIVNGSFETGDFTGWQTIGAASVVTASFGTSVPAGSYQAFLTNSVGAGAVIEFGTHPLRQFLNTTPLQDTDGSAIKTQVTADAGDILSFDWRFLTNEYSPSNNVGAYQDFATLYVDGVGTNIYRITKNTPDDFHLSTVSGYYHETAPSTFAYAFKSSGIHTVGFLVMNGSDTSVSSALTVDNLQLNAVPLPAAAWSALPAFGLLAWRHRRRRL